MRRFVTLIALCIGFSLAASEIQDVKGADATAAADQAHPPGFQQDGRTLVTSCCNSQNRYKFGPGTVTLVGIGAGANLPPEDFLTTAVGFRALGATRNKNAESTAVGWMSQQAQTTGGFNTTLGIATLYQCQTCDHDIAIGTDALKQVRSPHNDVAIGVSALIKDSSTGNNMAIGNYAMQSADGSSGTGNIAIGNSSMAGPISTAHDNTVLGWLAAGAGKATTASENVIIGSRAGDNIAADSENTLIGFQAGRSLGGSGGSNTFVGSQAGSGVTTGMNNIIVGRETQPEFGALHQGNNNILIGGFRTASPDASGQIVIGNVLFYNAASTLPPKVSCGEGATIDPHANSKSGTVTAGTGSVRACTITVAAAYVSWNHCRVTSQSPVPEFGYRYNRAAITLTAPSQTVAIVVERA
jgi:hypothetical protein